MPYKDYPDITIGILSDWVSCFTYVNMEEVISDPARAAEKGKRAASDMLDKWQWQHAAEKAMQWFQENSL